MRSSEEIRSQIHPLSFTAPVLGCLLKTKVDEVILVINPTSKEQLITLPEGDWAVLADHQYAEIIPKNVVKEEEIMIEPISLNVLLKK
jgi:pullulanase